MNKPQIIEELDLSIYMLDLSDNTLIANKLRRIKESLKNEWDLSDFYMELMKKELYYYEKLV
jgi:hypothetical protein